MSKKEKNIAIIENERMIKGQVVLDLSIDHRSLGTVTQSGDEFVAKLPNGEVFRAKQQDEAVSFLIREYHLHQGR
ncbi:DUF2969 domain-containing protein [Ligilactobacillus saerimneri]|uniref:DUF2969 domain-containing protein n=1 Tax=Ligilactobacillus saerimneri TaxID=228229 RepID=UPI0030CC2B2E